MHRTTTSKAPDGAPTKRGARLLALAVVSDQLVLGRGQMPAKARRALQRVARGLYRSLSDASRTTYVRHLHERYPAACRHQIRHQHR
ncbi:MAG: hypothetical protein ACYC7F_02405 [Gemmatimonadaceae bacterium]